MIRPSVALFDIGNVLIEWHQDRLLDKAFELTGITDTTETRALFRHWNDLWDAGSQNQLSQAQKTQYPALVPLIDAYHANWSLSLGAVIEESFDIADELKQRGLRLYTASNFATDTFPSARARLPRLDLFDAVHISGTTGICKPDPAFWTDMMRRFDFTADEAIFIDDRQTNIEGAASVGIATHLFTTPQKLRDALTARGLLA